jgi:two-component system, NtrC family, response regulator HupR/HoxA
MSEARTILFVDDEEKILKSLQRGLLDDPYNCLFATSGKEALEILEKNEVHVICTDMRMPEMNGLELLRIVKDKYPLIVRVVLSGYTMVGMLLTAINQGEIFKFITKPWRLEEDFKSVLQQAVDQYNLCHEHDALAAEVERLKNTMEKMAVTAE